MRMIFFNKQTLFLSDSQSKILKWIITTKRKRDKEFKKTQAQL
jgi:hypothetical protein